MNAAALRQLSASLRYNIKQARADLDAMEVHTADQFYHQGYQSGRVATMEFIADTLDLLAAGEDTAERDRATNGGAGYPVG